MKILANDGLSEKAIKTLEGAGFEVLTTKVAQNQLAPFINEEQIDILLVRSATQAKRDLIAHRSWRGRHGQYRCRLCPRERH